MYATKKPAGKVPMVLKVVAYNKDKKGQDIRGGGSASYETNNDGHVSFRVDVPRDTVRLDVRVSGRWPSPTNAVFTIPLGHHT